MDSRPSLPSLEGFVEPHFWAASAVLSPCPERKQCMSLRALPLESVAELWEVNEKQPVCLIPGPQAG